jgi:hypothetical protein
MLSNAEQCLAVLNNAEQCLAVLSNTEPSSAVVSLADNYNSCCHISHCSLTFPLVYIDLIMKIIIKLIISGKLLLHIKSATKPILSLRFSSLKLGLSFT